MKFTITWYRSFNAVSESHCLVRDRRVLQVVVLDAEVRLFAILVFFSFGSNFSQAHNSKTKRFAQTQQNELELTRSISSNLLYKYQAQVNGEQTRKFIYI
jgi:hypothetical protein